VEAAIGCGCLASAVGVTKSWLGPLVGTNSQVSCGFFFFGLVTVYVYSPDECFSDVNGLLGNSNAIHFENQVVHEMCYHLHH
jgi:hypothetical protein